MSNIDKQALRGQIVEGSYYLAECGHCGEMYPSNKLNGGEPLFSGDYGECFCHLCGADDTDIADCGAWGSEAVTAWNYQQKRIEALLDELEAENRISSTWRKTAESNREKLEAAERRIAELEARTLVPVEPTLDQLVAGKRRLTSTGRMSRLMSQRLAEVYRAMVSAAAAGKGEAL